MKLACILAIGVVCSGRDAGSLSFCRLTCSEKLYARQEIDVSTPRRAGRCLFKAQEVETSRPAGRANSETMGHLFLGCVFARELWFSLLSPVGLAMLVPEYDEEIGEWWLRLRQRLDSSARPIFDSMFLLVAWNLWKERNSVTFGRAAATDVTARA